MAESSTWWNGNKTKLWRFIVIAAITGLISVGGWVLITVRDVPANYVSKPEFRFAIQEQKNNLERAVTEQNVRLEGIDKKVTEINRFLRNYFSGRPYSTNDGD